MFYCRIAPAVAAFLIFSITYSHYIDVIIQYTYVCKSCNMHENEGFAWYICMPKARGIRAMISGKWQMHILQVLFNTFIAIVAASVGWIPQVIVTLVCVVISSYKLLMHYGQEVEHLHLPTILG